MLVVDLDELDCITQPVGANIKLHLHCFDTNLIVTTNIIECPFADGIVHAPSFTNREALRSEVSRPLI